MGRWQKFGVRYRSSPSEVWSLVVSAVGQSTDGHTEVSGWRDPVRYVSTPHWLTLYRDDDLPSGHWRGRWRGRRQ
jgi:hypothetical protein